MTALLLVAHGSRRMESNEEVRYLTERLRVVSPSLDVLCSPGHTDDGDGFLLSNRAFTGDTRLIRGTGRADFQASDPVIHRKDRCVPRAIPS